MTDKQIPAFPTNTGLGQHQAEGMTLRDYFAAKALANLYTQHETNPDKTVEWAYQVADAMLKQRNQ